MTRSHMEGWRLAEALSLSILLLVPHARAGLAPPDDTRSAEKVVRRHVVAVGATGAGSSGARRFKGTYRSETRERRGLGPGAFEMYVQPPDRWVVRWSEPGPGGVVGEGFKRGSGWSATWSGVHAWTAEQEAQKTRDIAPLLGVRLTEGYSRFSLAGERELAGRLADVVKAKPVEGGADEVLYFERQTGLLIGRDVSRKVWIADDLFEDVPFSYRYDDYRVVGAMRIPFAVHASAPLYGYELTLTEAATSSPIDEARFDPPTTAKR